MVCYCLVWTKPDRTFTSTLCIFPTVQYQYQPKRWICDISLVCWQREHFKVSIWWSNVKECPLKRWWNHTSTNFSKSSWFNLKWNIDFHFLAKCWMITFGHLWDGWGDQFMQSSYECHIAHIILNDWEHCQFR